MFVFGLISVMHQQTGNKQIRDAIVNDTTPHIIEHNAKFYVFKSKYLFLSKILW